MSDKKLIRLFGLTFFFLLIALLTFPLTSRAQDNLVIGLIPEMNVFKQKQRFEPLARYLSKELKINVQLTILSRYGNIIKRLEDQKIDAAFLGSFTGALAISQLGIEPLVRPVNMDGTSTYHGHIFVRKDSGINTIADMKGKTLALVERATTAGYVFPLAWFKHQGADNFSSYFKEHFFAGSHDATIDAVLAGEADVGAGKNTIYDRVRQGNPRIDKELTILASSPPVPSNGLCVRPEIEASIQENIKRLLLDLHNHDQGLEILRILGAKRFVETKKEDYQPVIDMAKEAGISLEKYDYYNP